MSKFFIHRPVFAWVLAIIMMIAGGLAILQLPIAQYPTIAPPAVAISAPCGGDLRHLSRCGCSDRAGHGHSGY